MSLGLVLLLLPGCTNLDEKWYSETTPSTYFTSKESIYSFLARPYTHWRWYQEFDRAIMQECSTDEMCVSQKGIHYNDVRYAQLQHHSWTPIHPNNQETWRGTGQGIAFALATKESLQNLDYTKFGLTEETKNDHLMKLQTLLAYFYLRGLDFYGAMPIYTTSTTTEAPRSTARETFDYIEKLLTEAIPKLLPKKQGDLEEGFPHQATAAALLAELYFNAEVYTGEQHFDKCAEICQNILDGKYGYYKLESNWYGPFGFENNKSSEIIWSAPSDNTKGARTWQFERYYHNNMKNYFDLGGYSSNDAMHLQPSLKPTGDPYTDADFYKLGRPFAKFNDKDLRKKMYVYKGNGEYEGMFVFGKAQRISRSGITVSCTGLFEYPGQVLSFVDQVAQFKKVKDGEYASVSELPSNINTGEENSGVRLVKLPVPDNTDKKLAFNPDQPVIRLAEIYYMLAECKYRLGDKQGAADLFNQVRRRNFENGNDPDPVTVQNINKYRILDEWMVEFIGEQRRRTDLRRWGLYTTGAWWDHRPTNDDHYELYPIPEKYISVSNNLKQNPGYGGAEEMSREDAGIFKVKSIE